MTLMNFLSNITSLHPFAQASLGGLLIGLASWLLLASMGRVAGISGIAANALSPAQGVPAHEKVWRWAYTTKAKYRSNGYKIQQAVVPLY